MEIMVWITPAAPKHLVNQVRLWQVRTAVSEKKLAIAHFGPRSLGIVPPRPDRTELMLFLALYAITAVIFLAADAVALRIVIKPVFERHLGDWLLDPVRFAPAVVFYLAYVAGLVWLVSWPAYKGDAPLLALANGAVLGALAYGTYEFTNYATLKRWTVQQVLVDGLWGTVLTATAAMAGVLILRAMAPVS
jgi:uncharacterized membrane protein